MQVEAGVPRADERRVTRTPHTPSPPPATVPLNKLHAETPNRFSAFASPPHRSPNNTKSVFYHHRDIVNGSTMKL